MAVFDPNVPETDPRYAPEFTNLSRPISAYEIRGAADKSKGIALEGLGKALTGAVEDTDAVFKNTIKDEAYNKLTPVNNQYTSALEASLNQPASAPQQTSSNTDKGPQEAPYEVSQGINNISKLDQARKLKPELQTLYSGQVASIEQDLRSKYPGYRSYIDEEVSRITGGVNANEHLKNLMTLAADNSTKKQAWSDKLDASALELVRTNGDSHLMAEISAHRAGKISDEQLGASIAGANTEKNQNEMDLQRANLGLKNGEFQGKVYEQKITGIAQNVTTNFVQGVLTGGGQTSIESMIQHVQSVAAGEAKNDPVELNKLSNYFRGKATDLESLITAKFNQKPDGGNGLSWAQIINDPSKINAIVKQNTDTLNRYADLIDHDKVGLVFSMANDLKAQKERTASNLAADPKLGPFALRVNAIHEMFGENKAVDDILTNIALSSDASKEAMGWVKDYATGIALGKKTFNDALEDGKDKGAVNPATGKYAGIGPKTNMEVLNLMDYIANPKSPPEWANKFAHALYDPANEPMLDNIQKDTVDAKGRPIAGKYYVWNMAMSDKNIEATNKLAKDDPSLLEARHNWTEKTFAKLFRGSLATIKDATEGNDLSGIKIAYNNTSHHFASSLGDLQTTPAQQFIGKLFPPVPSGVGTFIRNEAGGRSALDEEISKVNGAIDRLVAEKKSEGASPQDISAYLFNTLKTMGVTPQNIQDDSPEAQFARSILQAHRPPEPEATKVDPFNTKDKNKSQEKAPQ